MGDLDSLPGAGPEIPNDTGLAGTVGLATWVQSVEQRLSAMDAKLRATLVATMAAQMLPLLTAFGFSKDDIKHEDAAIEVAFRLAGKIAARMEKAVKGV